MAFRSVGVIVLIVCASCSGLNDRPIIGIVSQPTPSYLSQFGASYVVADYVKWVESSGARVVPIFYDADPAELKLQMSYINGLLFTGGGLNLTAGVPYFDVARTLIEQAMSFNDAGDYFPVWGTCQGFQLLSISGAGYNSSVLQAGFDSVNLALSLNFTASAPGSRLLSAAVANGVYDVFRTEAVTQNLHVDGVDPQLYTSNPQLAASYDLLAWNLDRKGRPFGSMIEGRRYPFYATQFHPERNIFEWDLQETALSHTYDAIFAMQYLGRFFANEARKSNHSFPSIAEEMKALIYNFSPVFTGALNDDYPEVQTYIWKNM
eukprot:TRINITY_DN1597_c0_g1_i1.p1 TRINITY_DN1597_c0_g1~~TRINITY_DN1597_c0_g1_i1.p1  ORF type:complete len:320 (+),score=84.04 TRINITY_DN1597_c0_g1_i1:885-1844(+)